jgi:PAS domain S-box-containing protein
MHSCLPLDRRRWQDEGVVHPNQPADAGSSADADVLTLLWTTRAELREVAARADGTLAEAALSLTDEELAAIAARVRERYFGLWHPAISRAVRPEDLLVRRAAIRFGDAFRLNAPWVIPAALPRDGWTPVLQLTRSQLLRGLVLAEKGDRESVAALSPIELQRLAPGAKHLADPLVWPRALVCALAYVLGVPPPALPDPVAGSRVERILNTIDEGAVWGWDDEGDFFSPSVHRLAGAPPDTDALTLWTDIIHPDDYEAFARAAPSEPAEVEYRVLGLDGVTRCVLDRTWVQHLPDGGIFVKGMAYDITRRRGAEEALRQAHTDLAAMHAALREAHEQVARLVETIDEVLWTATFVPGDFAGAQLYVSPSLERLIGRSLPAEPAHALAVWRAAVHPDDVLVADAARDETLEAKDGRAEYRVQSADGAVRWVLDRRRVSRLEDGRLQVCGSLTDVTERRRMEEELLRNNGIQHWASTGGAADGGQRSRHLRVVGGPESPGANSSALPDGPSAS